MTVSTKRKLLKGLGVAAPVAWITPVVNGVILPAHAQTTTEPPEPDSPTTTEPPEPDSPIQIRWVLSGVMLRLGGTISGSFDYNVETNTYSDVSLTVSGAPTASHNGSYVQVNPAAINRSILLALKAGSVPGSLSGEPQVNLSFAGGLPLTEPVVGDTVALSNPPTAVGNCSIDTCLTLANTGLNVPNAGVVIRMEI